MILTPSFQFVLMVKLLYNLIFGDCLEKMKSIGDGSIDFILTDPPYGTTACKWDVVIDVDLMWREIWRVLKPNRAVALFGQEPFSSLLRVSAMNEFKYDFYWRKSRPSGFTNAKLKPLKDIEIVSIFSKGKTANGSTNNMLYNPQGLTDVDIDWKRPKLYEDSSDKGISPVRKNHKLERKITKSGYPRQVLDYSNNNNNLYHPTEKPVDLLEYLIRTYSNEGDTVLDFTMGSGSTGVACNNTNRNFIGIENEEKYFDIAKKRMNGE